MLRSSLVNNEVQSLICNELGITQLHTQFADFGHQSVFAKNSTLRVKDKADLVEG